MNGESIVGAYRMGEKMGYLFALFLTILIRVFSKRNLFSCVVYLPSSAHLMYCKHMVLDCSPMLLAADSREHVRFVEQDAIRVTSFKKLP